MGFLIAFLTRALQWLHDFLLSVALPVFKAILVGLATVISWIPTCSCFASLGTLLGNIGSASPLAAHFAAGLHIADGLAAIMCGYILRFSIRRIFFIN